MLHQVFGHLPHVLPALIFAQFLRLPGFQVPNPNSWAEPPQDKLCAFGLPLTLKWVAIDDAFKQSMKHVLLTALHLGLVKKMIIDFTVSDRTVIVDKLFLFRFHHKLIQLVAPFNTPVDMILPRGASPSQFFCWNQSEDDHVVSSAWSNQVCEHWSDCR